MGAYKAEAIDNDFKIVSNGIGGAMTELFAIYAKIMLESLPDNQPRDMAISHLLQAAEMVTISILFNRPDPQPKEALEKIKKMVENQQDLPPEFSKMVDDHFWELV